MHIQNLTSVPVDYEPPLGQRAILLYSGSTLVLHSGAFFFLLFPWLSDSNFALMSALIVFMVSDFLGVKTIVSATRLPAERSNMGWVLLATFGLAQILLAVWLSVFKPSFGKDLAWLIGLLSASGICLGLGIVFAFSARMTRRIAYVIDVAHAHRSTGLSKGFPRKVVGIFFTVMGSLCLWIAIRETIQLFSAK